MFFRSTEKGLRERPPAAPEERQEESRVVGVYQEERYHEAAPQLAKSEASENDDASLPETGADESGPDVAAVAAALERGHAAMVQGDYAAAITAFEQCAQLSPLEKQAYVGLARAHGALGDREAVFHAYTEWIAYFPEDALPHYEMALLYASGHMDMEALEALKQFQALSRQDAGMYTMSAALFRQLEMPAEEGEILEAWVEQQPQSTKAQRVLADYYTRAGDLAAALGAFERIAEARPEDPAAHRDLGDAYRRLGQSMEAEAAYATAVGLDPDNTVLRLQLAHLYRENGHRDAALQAYATVAAQAPESPEGQQSQRYLAQLQQ